LNGVVPNAVTMHQNPIGHRFMTSVSEECASVENLDQANDAAESNSSTISPSQSNLNFAINNGQAVKELPPNPVEHTAEEERLNKILALTRQLQQRNTGAPLNHNSKNPCSNTTR